MNRPNAWTAGTPFGSFCQTKAVLLRCVPDKAGAVSVERDWAAGLPDTIHDADRVLATNSRGGKPLL